MKLKEIMEKGYQLRAWSMRKIRGERFIVVKLMKTTKRGERFYEVHSPRVETILSDVEFTEPVLLQETR